MFKLEGLNTFFTVLLMEVMEATLQTETSESDLERLERRHLAIMFCDLVNSTLLAAQMDPEDLLQLIRAYRRLCTKIINGYDGFPASFTGDGIMSYFGYPRAHEDDAERATRSALDILEAINGRKARPDQGNWHEVSVRIGIASGLVVVGNPGISGEAHDQIVIGEAPNLAARLQSEAEPGTAIVCGNTRTLIRGAFRLKHIGTSSLRGCKMPQRLWQVTGKADRRARIRAGRPADPAELVGREAEYQRLVGLWDLARRGAGRVALVSGETGAGKTKLLEMLRRHVSAEPSGPLILQCSPENANDTLHPYLPLLLPAAGPAPENFPAGGILPGKPAPSRPCLVILEDAHRCDSASVRVINKLVALAPGKSVLLAISHRMPFQPPQKWSGQRHVENIHLGPLNQAAARSFIHRFAGEGQISSRVISGIIARSDGIPLFLEELTRTTLGAQRPANGTLQAKRAEFRIPGRIWAVLMARLDRQYPASREAVQIGAVLGRAFSYSLLADIWSRNSGNLDHALYSLCRSGELLQAGNGENTWYMFKWVLMREVAYQNTLRRVRQNLYRRIAGARGQNFPVRNIHDTGAKNDKKKY